MPAAAPLRGRHRVGLPVRPHRRGLRAHVYSTIYNWLVRWLFGVQACATSTSPSSCAAGRCSTRSTLESEGSFIDAELIVRAIGHGFKVVQFGVDYFPRTRGRVDAQLAGRDRQAAPGDVRRCGQSCGRSSPTTTLRVRTDAAGAVPGSRLGRSWRLSCPRPPMRGPMSRGDLGMQWRRMAPVGVVVGAVILAACLGSASGSSGDGQTVATLPVDTTAAPETVPVTVPTDRAPTTAATTVAPPRRRRRPPRSSFGRTSARATRATTSPTMQQRLVETALRSRRSSTAVYGPARPRPCGRTRSW